MPAPFDASEIPAGLPIARTGDTERIPLIVLAGEPNSGKTTLANFLLRVPVLKTDIVPNTPCPMLLRFDETAHLRIIQPDSTSSLRSLAELHLIKRGQARAVEVLLPLTLLRRIQILDLPGLSSSADIEANREWFALGDIQIWCATASQAWRASEQAKWQSLSAPRKPSMLVLTNKDLLSDVQFTHLAERASRETERFFSCWTAIATAQAIAARNTRGQIINHDAWVSTGAEDLMKKLISLLQSVVPHSSETAAHRRAEASSLPHPIQFFDQWRQRILSHTGQGASVEETATIMASELKAYSDEVLQPWIAANSQIVLSGIDVSALFPTTDAELADCLTPRTADPATVSPADILRQIEAEISDALRTGDNSN